MNKEPDIIVEILADQIIEPIDPMRTEHDRDKIYELAESIKTQGLINPITVRPHNGKYEIVAGHRRFKACLIAGKVKIPSVIRTMTDQEVLALRAHENLFREDVDPVDEAIFIGKIVGEDETKIPELAKQLNRSIQWIEDRLNILTYPDYFLFAIKENRIKLGVAKALTQIEDEVYRRLFFDNALRDGMSVWQADYYLAQWKNGVFQKSGELIVDPGSPLEAPSVKVLQQCEKCGEMAERPNLRAAFIHIECPPTPPEKTNDTDHDKL